MGINKQRFENDEWSQIAQKFYDDGLHGRKAAAHVKIIVTSADAC